MATEILRVKPGRLVILSGPSGVGKDTVLEAWHAADPRVTRVVACTTRKPRPGEVDGVDYHFTDVESFLRRAEEGAFLEFKEVYGNHYATPLSHMEAILESGNVAVLKIDVQGAAEVMPKRPDAIPIFLLPPSDAELERRIRGRGTEDEAATLRRLATAREEIAFSEAYPHRIVNAELAETVRRLREIVP